MKLRWPDNSRAAPRGPPSPRARYTFRHVLGCPGLQRTQAGEKVGWVTSTHQSGRGTAQLLEASPDGHPAGSSRGDAWGPGSRTSWGAHCYCLLSVTDSAVFESAGTEPFSFRQAACLSINNSLWELCKLFPFYRCRNNLTEVRYTDKV